MTEAKSIDAYLKVNSSKIYKYSNSLTSHGAIPLTSRTLLQRIMTRLLCIFSLPKALTACHHWINCHFLIQLFQKLVYQSQMFMRSYPLSTTKAMGIDGIRPLIWKHCALGLYKPIHHLFMLSISHYYLPKDWHMRLITSIYESENYRHFVPSRKPLKI